MAHRCFIVPPHLLKAISESPHNSDATRQTAQAALDSRQQFTAKRKDRIEAVIQSQHSSRSRPAARPQIPPYILRHISQSEHVDEGSRAAALRSLEITLDLETPRVSGEETAQLKELPS